MAAPVTSEPALGRNGRRRRTFYKADSSRDKMAREKDQAGSTLKLPGAGGTFPGDDAPAGMPGTGEDVCRECSGTGRIQSEECSNCGGTGKVIKGISGA